MVPRKFFVWPCINPNCIFAPRARLHYRDHFGRWNWQLPRNFVAKIDRLPDSGKKRERHKNKRLAHQRRLHFLLDSWRIGHACSGVKCFGRILRLNGQGGSRDAAGLPRLDVNLEFASPCLFDFRLKIRIR